MTREHVTVRVSFRSACLVVIALIGFGPVVALGGAGARPLQLRLVVPEPEVCLASGKLKMEAVFSNNSDLPISVYPSAIYDFSFIKTITSGNHSKVESHEQRKDVGTGDPALHEAPLVLPPHMSIVVPVEYDISDPYFTEPGAYSVRVAYMKMATKSTAADAVFGDFVSNEVLFEMGDCH